MTVKLHARLLYADDLNVDPAYQRLVVPSQVRWVVHHYDEVAFGRLLVARRADSTLWVVDGQQRLTAARQMGMKQVPCLVFDSADRRHEATVFKEINANRSAVKPMAVYKAALEAREPEAVAITAVAEERGYKIGHLPSTPEGWAVLRGIVTVTRIYRAGGAPLLADVLTLARDCWAGDVHATHNLVLAGLAYFMQKYAGDFDRDRLVRKLSAMTPMSLLRYITDHQRIAGGSNRHKLFTQAVVAVYNKGLRAGRLVWSSGDDSPGALDRGGDERQAGRAEGG